MEVILLERHPKLGNIGDVVAVKNGYARNFLIPTKKALRATADNKKVFEIQKQAIQKEFEAKKADAEKVAKKIEGKSIILIRQCSEDLRLYGSVNANDISKSIKEQLSQEIAKSSINLVSQIKYAGIYQIPVTIFADVQTTVKLAIARSEEEAKSELKNETANKLKKEAEELKAAKPAEPTEKEIVASEEKQAAEAIQEEVEAEEFSKEEDK